MTRYWRCCLLILGLSASGCTSDPNAPINQAFPIRQMDAFFNGLSPTSPPPSPPPPDYTRQPGYAPAYPPYAPQVAPDE